MLFSKPGPEDWALAREVHSLFARKPGASHIASRFALAHLVALIRERPVMSVLEFGSGIGTITYLLLRGLPPTAKIVCAERNEWCRSQFLNNIPPAMRSRITLLPEREPKIEQTFDLVIVDGPVDPENCGIGPGSLCFCEGTRSAARSAIAKGLTASELHIDFSAYFDHAGPWKLRWPMTRFGFRRPQLARKMKGCWIGLAQPMSS